MIARALPSLALLALLIGAAQEPPRDAPAAQASTARAPEGVRLAHGTFSPAALEPIGGSARVSLRPRRFVELSWTYTADGERRSREQQFQCDFWPTAAAPYGDAIYVGGRSSETGRTVIERLAFDLEPLPERLPKIRAQRVFEGERGDERLFTWMLPMDTTPEVGPRVLCQFRGSDDVGVFDPAARTLKIVLSSESFPALRDRDLLVAWAATHARLGAFYVLQRDPQVAAGPTVVLFDADRDGALDSWRSCAKWDDFVALVGRCGTDWKRFD